MSRVATSLAGCLAAAAALGLASAQVPGAAPPPPRLGPPQAPATAGEQAAALIDEGDRLRAAGSADEALASIVSYERAAALAEPAGETVLLARARMGKGLALVAAGRADEAHPPLQAAVAIAQGLRDPLLQADSLEALSKADAALRRTPEAMQDLREAARLAQAGGKAERAGRLRVAAADLAISAGMPDEARGELDAALAVFRQVSSPSLEMEVLERRGAVEWDSGDDVRALETWKSALAVTWDLGDESREGRMLLRISDAQRSLGDLEAAILTVREGLALCEKNGDLDGQADAQERLCGLYLSVRQPQAAVDRALAALRLRRQRADLLGEGRAHLALATAFRQLDRYEPALGALDEAEPLLQRAQPPLRTALLLERARTLASLRRVDDAAGAYDNVLDRLRVIGSTGRSGTGFDTPSDLPGVLREDLAFLAGQGHWELALDVALTPTAVAPSSGTDASPRGPDVAALQALAASEHASVLTWRDVGDSVLAWAVLPDGRIMGAGIQLDAAGAPLARLVARVAQLAPVVSATRGGADSAELDDALRRLHGILVAPLDATLRGSGSDRLIVWLPEALREIPMPLLRDASGHFLGEDFAVSHLAAAPLPLPEPRPGVRLLVDRSGGPAMESGLAASVLHALPPTAAGTGAAAPVGQPVDVAPAPSGGDSTVIFVGKGDAVLAGDASAALAAAAGQAWALPQASVIVLLGSCDAARPATAGDAGWLDVEPGRDGAPGRVRVTWRGLQGAVVVVPDCPVAARREVVAALFEAGARTVVGPRWRLAEADRIALFRALILALRPQRSVADAVRETLASARSGDGGTSVWGALSVEGSLR